MIENIDYNLIYFSLSELSIRLMKYNAEYASHVRLVCYDIEIYWFHVFVCLLRRARITVARYIRSNEHIMDVKHNE